MVALASPLPVALPIALIGGFTYWRRGLVELRIALWTALGGVPTVIAGSYLTAYIPGRVLMLITGVFVIVIGIRLLRGPLVSGPNGNAAYASRSLLIGVGATVGLLSGLLANGGGFLLVPAYLLLFRMEPQRCSATSLVAIAFLSVPGTWIHNRLGHVDFRLAELLAAGVIPATYAGARLAMHLNARHSRHLFGIFLLLFGTLFFLRTLHRIELYGWSI